MTVVIQGITQPVSSEGSRLSWATPSLVHEGLGHRAIEPDRIQGDAVLLPHACTTAQSRDHVMPLIARLIVPTIQPRAGLAAVKAWPGNRGACGSHDATASLDCGCARRSRRIMVGTEKRLSVEQRN